MPISPQPLETASAFGGRYSAYLSLSSLPTVPAAHREACQRVRKMTSDAFEDIVERDMPGRDRRHAMAHIRQIAMYICHVTLSLPIAEVAVCFGRHHSTVSITCQRVEDRREDAAFDEFVTAVEQSAKSVLEMLQAGAHD